MTSALTVIFSRRVHTIQRGTKRQIHAQHAEDSCAAVDDFEESIQKVFQFEFVRGTFCKVGPPLQIIMKFFPT